MYVEGLVCAENGICLCLTSSRWTVLGIYIYNNITRSMQSMFGASAGKLLRSLCAPSELLGCSVGIQLCLLRYFTFTLPTCKHHDTFTPIYAPYLSASSQPYFPLFSCFCGFCSMLSLPSSEPCLRLLSSFCTKQQLHNYGYKAWAEIMYSSRTIHDRQTTSAFT